MTNELLKSIEVLALLNNRVNKSIISEKEFVEQKDNINDFKILIKKMNHAINVLNNSENSSTEDIMEQLHILHLSFSDCIWQFDQVHALVKQMLGNYRDSSENK